MLSAPDPGICYGGGGGGGAVLPEGRQCMRSCLNGEGGGGCSPLTAIYQNWGGGGGGGQSTYSYIPKLGGGVQSAS